MLRAVFLTARCVRQALAAEVGSSKPNEAQPQVWRRLLVMAKDALSRYLETPEARRRQLSIYP